jgi:hypothetical protein
MEVANRILEPGEKENPSLLPTFVPSGDVRAFTKPPLFGWDKPGG